MTYFQQYHFRCVLFYLCGESPWHHRLTEYGWGGYHYVIELESTILRQITLNVISLRNMAQIYNSESVFAWMRFQRQRQRHLDVVPDSGPKRAATPERNRWQTEENQVNIGRIGFL